MKNAVIAGLFAGMALVLGSPGKAAGPRDRLSVVGSSTLFPLASAVAEAFGRGGRWPTPVIESMGTGNGFQVFCRGVSAETPDITDASRPMNAEEQRDCERHRVGDVVGLRVGFDGILLVNTKQGPALSLTREQLYRAVAKRVPLRGRLVPNPYRRWRDIDPALPDLPILVYGPAPNHGTRDAFVALAMVPVCEQLAEVRVLAIAERHEACRTVREDGAWVDVTGDYAVLLTKIVAEPKGVGVLGYSFLERNRERLQAARIDGVAPALETIAGGSYPLSRPLYLYVKGKHVGHMPGLAEFLAEFLSDRAAGPEGYLTDLGLVPLSHAELEVERRKATALASQRPQAARTNRESRGDRGPPARG